MASIMKEYKKIVYYPVIIFIIVHKNCSIEINTSKQCFTQANAHLINLRERKNLFSPEIIVLTNNLLFARTLQTNNISFARTLQTKNILIVGNVLANNMYNLIASTMQSNKNIHYIYFLQSNYSQESFKSYLFIEF